jgi:hypothetical protein
MVVLSMSIRFFNVRSILRMLLSSKKNFIPRCIISFHVVFGSAKSILALSKTARNCRITYIFEYLSENEKNRIILAYKSCHYLEKNSEKKGTKNLALLSLHYWPVSGERVWHIFWSKYLQHDTSTKMKIFGTLSQFLCIREQHLCIWL